MSEDLRNLPKAERLRIARRMELGSVMCFGLCLLTSGLWIWFSFPVALTVIGAVLFAGAYLERLLGK